MTPGIRPSYACCDAHANRRPRREQRACHRYDVVNAESIVLYAYAPPLHTWAELSTVRQRRDYELACPASALVACQALSVFRYSGASRGDGLSYRRQNHTTQMAGVH